MRNQPLRCKENKIKPKTLDQKDQGKDKDKGKTARTRKFTKATYMYINWAWTAPCWLCFWDWKYEYTRCRASSGDHRLAIKGQLNKQETHYNCSTQTEAFDYLYWSVRLFSLLGTVYTLNVPQQDLTNRFDVSQSTVLRIFANWFVHYGCPSVHIDQVPLEKRGLEDHALVF